jgi:MFS family permease
VRLVQGIRYVRRRSDLVLVLFLLFGVATFGLNYQLTMALMARQQFHLGAEAFGLMSTALAIGALLGSLLAARRPRATLRLVASAAVLFGLVEIAVGFSPSYVVMLCVLPFAGAMAMTFTTSAQSYLQSRSESWVRGRVMGIYTLMFFGGTPIGAPLIGLTADHLGPRSGLVGGGLGTLVFVLVCIAVYARRASSPTDERDDAHVVSDELLGQPGIAR